MTWQSASYGVLGSRPSAAALPDAYEYFATDDSGGTLYRVQGGAWVQVAPGAGATTADIPDSSNKRYVTDAELTVLAATSGTNTGDQTTVSGNAGTATALATSRNIDGQAFNGTADITVIAPGTHAATGKTTPVDDDEVPLIDSAASNVLKKLTWANVKATLKTYFDGLYQATTSIDNLSRSARSSNTILAAGDKGTVIAATAAYTQTFTAAATLGAGWWCIVKNDTNNGTTVLILDPNGAETIDGVATPKLYSGETRLITCDGANFLSDLIAGGFAKFTPGSSTFQVPAGIEKCRVVCIGGGGQGGGACSSVSTAKSGGGGGGGGSVSTADLRVGDIGAAGTTVTVSVGAGGSAGGGGGAAGAGSNGTQGDDGVQTTFGAFLKAGSGGGGNGGQAGSISGGAGGGVIGSATHTTAGSPSSATAISGQGATAKAAGANVGGASEWGGASGGCSSISTPAAGGDSIYAGPAGGAGGTVTVGNVGGNGSKGGGCQLYGSGGGGAAGSGGASPTGGAASDGTTFVGPYCGSAGGGGGGGSATTGAAGGAGGIGAGGGGGGASSSATSSTKGGNGGAGGSGECRVWYS